MKCVALLAILSTAATAFQVRNQAPPIHYKTVMDQRDQKLNRAEECAVTFDFCDADELDALVGHLEDFQFKGQGKDHEKVYHILRSQSELKRMMKDLAADDQVKDDHFDGYLLHHW